METKYKKSAPLAKFFAIVIVLVSTVYIIPLLVAVIAIIGLYLGINWIFKSLGIRIE